MSTIVTRTGKGSPLTWVEADANFTNLNADKLEAGFPANNVANTPLGDIIATNVQEAINELSVEKVAFTRLDDSDGSSLVGFLPAGTGAIYTNSQSKLRENVSVKDFGAIGDGVTDDAAAVLAALQTGGKITFPGASAYAIKSNISVVLTQDTIIDFNDQHLIFDGGRIEISGQVVASGRTLTTNAARYTTSVTLSSGTSILPGDLLYINTSVAPSYDWSDTKKDCVRIRSVSGASVTLDAGLNFAYTTADAGLSITIYRPVQLTLIAPNMTSTALDSDVTPRRMIDLVGLVNVKIVRPTIKGVLPFSRNSNIYRVGIQILASVGVDIQDPFYEAMSYPIGVYWGSRDVTESGVSARYNHHSHADVGDWSSDYRLVGIHSEDSYQALGTHPCFRAFAEKVDVRNDYGLSNWRCCGGGIKDGVIHSTVDDTAELPQFQNTTPNAGYEYINDDADFVIENVVFDTPSRITKAPFGVKYGRHVTVSGVTASDMYVSFAQVDDVASAIFGPQNRIGTAQTVAPSTAWVLCPSRVHVPPLLDSYLDTGVWHINPRARMVDQEGKHLRCFGRLISGVTTDPAVISVRIHVNAFAGVLQVEHVIGKIKFFTGVTHENVGYFSTIEKHWNFGFKVNATSSISLPTTPVYTSGLSGQANESIALTLGNVTYAGVTQLGANGDNYVQFDLTLSSGRTTPRAFIDYELELNDVMG